MDNLDMPASPSQPYHLAGGDGSEITISGSDGFTKREQACLTMGVADSGCAELDAIIEKGNKQRLAGLAMQGLLTLEGYVNKHPGKQSLIAIVFAKSLLEQLNKR
tara:strand:+ start:241 stop:555 length:315 start_codon:yes stop_codon:yes gene_type:complete